MSHHRAGASDTRTSIADGRGQLRREEPSGAILDLTGCHGEQPMSLGGYGSALRLHLVRALAA